MKKYGFVLGLLYLSCISGLGDKAFTRALDEYVPAYNEFAKHAASMRTSVSVSTIGNTTTTTYAYSGSEAAIEALKAYRKAAGNFQTKVLTNVLGNGFMLGVGAACLNKAISNKSVDKKTIALMVAAATTIVCVQNYQVGKVPFYPNYTTSLTPRDNYFGVINSVGRVCALLSAASASYLGTHYTLDFLKKN